MGGVIKAVSRLVVGSKPKANTGPTASEIAAQQAAQAAADQATAEEVAKRRRASQQGVIGETLGSGDAPTSLRQTLLGGGAR